MGQHSTETFFNSPVISHFILAHPDYIPAGELCALTAACFPEDYSEPIFAEEIEEVWQLIVPVFDRGTPFEVREDLAVLSGADLVSVYFYAWAYREADMARIIDKVNEERAKAIRFKVLSGSGSPDWSN